MTNSERPSNTEHSGYVFGPTPPALKEGMPILEAADMQNDQTTILEGRLARHYSGVEPLDRQQFAEVFQEHLSIADQPVSTPELIIE